MKIELQRKSRTSFPMGIMDFIYSRDESYLLAACMDGVYRLGFGTTESPDENSKPILLETSETYLSGIGWTRENSHYMTTGYDGILNIRTVVEGELAATRPNVSASIHNFWSWQSTVSPDQKWIASVSGQYLAGSEDYKPAQCTEETVKILNSDGELRHSFQMLPSVQCVAFSNNSEFVAAANLMGDISVWNLTSGELLAQWRTSNFTSWGIIKSHCYIGGIFAISFSHDDQHIYVAGMGDMKDPMAGNGKQLWEKYAWTEKDHPLVQSTKGDQSGEGLMETLAWHPSGQFFVMAGRLRGGNWNVGLFDAEQGNLVASLKTGMRVVKARFSSDGSVLYLGGMQGQPERKENRFPDFGYLERYTVVVTA